MNNSHYETIKTKSVWHNIQVIYPDKDPVIFELNDKGKLKKKIKRQIPRDISFEFQKIQLQKDSDNSQQFNDQKSTDDCQSSFSINSKELTSIKHISNNEFKIMLTSAFQFEDNEYSDDLIIYK